MKKILLLMLIMGAFSPLINAYEYLITAGQNLHNGYYRYYLNENHVLVSTYYINSSQQNVDQRQVFFTTLNYIGKSNGYITRSEFYDYYSNDLLFLNDLYTQRPNEFLNYLYNPNNFSFSNYIIFDDYQLLYNSDGFAVESIVNGVWAGLYSDDEKGVSGALYSSNGTLLYYNGEPATPVDSFYVWLARFTHNVVGEVFQELSRTMIFGTILCIFLVLAMLYFCMENFLFVRPRRRSRPYYLYGEDGSRHTFRQVELESKNYARLNPEWAQRRREENERVRAGR